MNLFGSGIKLGGAVGVGAAAVLLAPVVVPLLASVMKPLVKTVIKGGMLAIEGMKVAVAETKETLEDITAEAKAEISEGRKRPSKAVKKAAA